MSTNNFHYNTKKVYAILENGLNSTEDEKSLVLENLKEQGLNIYKNTGTPGEELRSYPAHIFATIEEKIIFAGESINIIVSLIIRYGYYEYANFDYETVIDYKGIACDDDIDAVVNEFLLDKPSQVMNKDRLYNKIYLKMNNILEKVEKAFELNSYVVLDKTGGLSNSEAFYKEAN